MIILLHSSKTMRRAPADGQALHRPQLLEQAERLVGYLQTLSASQLARVMSISPALAEKTQAVLNEWTAEPGEQSPAVDSFIGDIYSGLHANDLPPADRDYADQTLRILSGLYGILRPYDGIYPYRLEMGYRLPDPPFADLYDFWGSAIAGTLPPDGPIFNLAADEYSKTVTRFVDKSRLFAPRFLTVNPKTGKPGFVVVHAKIARGAFARWLIVERIEDPARLTEFEDLGYQYVEDLSSAAEPAFVCEAFGGKGRSIRLVK